MTHQRNYSVVGTGLVLAWLFVVFSFIVSNQVGVDWFSRSGSVMCLFAAAANFALVKIHQRDLANIFNDNEHSSREKAERILKPSGSYLHLSRLSYLTGIVGTAIWGYGDLVL